MGLGSGGLHFSNGFPGVAVKRLRYLVSESGEQLRLFNIVPESKAGVVHGNTHNSCLADGAVSAEVGAGRLST